MFMKFSSERNIELLKEMRKKLDSAIFEKECTLENFSNALESVTSIVANVSGEIKIITNYIPRLKFYERFSTDKSIITSSIHHWFKVFADAKSRIDSSIDFENERNRRIQIEEFEKQHSRDIKIYQDQINQLKNSILNYNQQLSSIREENTKLNKLKDTIEQNNKDLTSMQEENTKLNQLKLSVEQYNLELRKMEEENDQLRNSINSNHGRGFLCTMF